MVFSHYIDDSGSDEKSPVTVVGGPIFVQHNFHEFHFEWGRIVSNHGIELPIHMKDFARPDGRLAKVSDQKRKELFHDLVYLINRNTAYSMTVEVETSGFQSAFPPKVFRGHITADSLGFFWCMVMNNIIIRKHQGGHKMAYLVSCSPRNTQYNDSHSYFRSFEESKGMHITGAIGFDKMQDVHALQAADLIVWAQRRKRLRRPFNEGCEPLELLTRKVESEIKPSVHFYYPVSNESTKKLSDVVGNPQISKGKRHSLLGVVSRNWELPTKLD